MNETSRSSNATAVASAPDNPPVEPSVETDLSRPASTSSTENPQTQAEKGPAFSILCDKVLVPLFGVLFPIVTLILLLVDHFAMQGEFQPNAGPSELAIIAAIPLAMFALIIGSKRNPLRLRLSLLAGTIMGASMFALFIAEIYMIYNASGKVWIPAACISSLICALYFACRLAGQWELAASRRLAIGATALGFALPMVVVAATEVRPTLIRCGEILATDPSSAKRDSALRLLGRLNCVPEMRMHCRGSSTEGIISTLTYVDPSQLRSIIFKMTGIPEDLKSTVVTDSDLSRQVVGNKLYGLELTRSALYVVPTMKHLCGTVYWTMVFKNTGAQAQEARVKIQLPPGAVVNGMTFWMNGKPKEASVAFAGSASQAYQWVTQGRRDPALVSYLDDHCVLAQCYPVPVNGETKIRLSIAEPMSLNTHNHADLSLPRLVDGNCATASDHVLQVETKEQIRALGDLGNLIRSADGVTLEAPLRKDAIEKPGLAISFDRTLDMDQDTLVGTGRRTIRAALETTKHKRPHRIVVVLDGGSAAKEEAAKIIEQLSKSAESIPCQFVLASDQQPRAVALAEAKSQIASCPFAGGYDNTRALVYACEVAGRAKDSAVVWIHGPQPGYDNQIYTMAPHLMQSTIYDIAQNGTVGAGALLLRNHKELGTPVTVPHFGSMRDDLQALISVWGTESSQLVFKYGPVTKEKLSYNHVADCLAAYQECLPLIARGNDQKAGYIACSKGIVTKASSAVVLENASDYSRNGITDWGAKQEAKAARQATQDDSNPGTAWDIRKNYMLRYPVAKEFGPSTASAGDIIINKPAGLTPPPPPQVPVTNAAGAISDANPNVAFNERKSYHMGYPFAAEAFRNDVLTKSQGGDVYNPLTSNLGDYASGNSETQFQIIDRSTSMSILSLLPAMLSQMGTTLLMVLAAMLGCAFVFGWNNAGLSKTTESLQFLTKLARKQKAKDVQQT